jgi:predicted ATPase
MIEEVFIKGYKCFKDISLSVPKLTVLAGVNGAGKSAFIQALLLAWECGKTSGEIVPLNGETFELGSAGEVAPHDSNFPHTVDISWRLTETPEVFRRRLTAKANDDRFLYVTDPIEAETGKNVIWSGLGGFTFLSAERSGPFRFSGRQFMNKENLSFGSKGEFCADIISICDSMPVQNKGIVREYADDRRYPEGYSKQIEAWMHALGFGLQIRSKASSVKDIAALEFLDERFSNAEWISPVHAGLGVNCALPVVAAGLTALPGGILIVESPEAHLHPAAQSKMGGFLARLASTGVQVFLETHSDHVLNGIRLAAAKNDIAKEDVLFAAFGKSSDGTITAEEIRIREDNSLSAWPEGFFDQIQTDLSEIASLRVF